MANQPFRNVKKLSHAFAHRTELIISFNLKTAPLFFPFKRIILRPLTCLTSVMSFSSGMYTRGSGSCSTIFLKNLETALKEERMYRYKCSVCITICSKISGFKQGSVEDERSSGLFWHASGLVRPQTLDHPPQSSVYPPMLGHHPQSLSRHRPLIIEPSVLSASRRFITVTRVLFVHAYFNTVYRDFFVLRRRHAATGSAVTNRC